MNSLTESDLVDLVIQWIKEYKNDDGLEDRPITAETDLIGTGLLDSYGMIDLLMFVETRTGCRIDLADVDPTEFSVVRGVCRIALRNHQGEPSRVDR